MEIASVVTRAKRSLTTEYLVTSGAREPMYFDASDPQWIHGYLSHRRGSLTAEESCPPPSADISMMRISDAHTYITSSNSIKITSYDVAAAIFGYKN